MLRIAVGIFLMAHGLVHWVLIAPHTNVPNASIGSFLTNSWLVGNLGISEAVARWLLYPDVVIRSRAAPRGYWGPYAHHGRCKGCYPS